MSKMKSWMEDYIDALAALMVVASFGKYEHRKMVDIAWECLDAVDYNMSEFDVDYMVKVSMEQDWE